MPGHCVKQYLETGSPYFPLEQLVTQLLVLLSPKDMLGDIGQLDADTHVYPKFSEYKGGVYAQTEAHNLVEGSAQVKGETHLDTQLCVLLSPYKFGKATLFKVPGGQS